MPLNLPRLQRHVDRVTPVAFARAAGITYASLRRILRGERPDPPLSTLEGLAKACGCKVQDLISLAPPRESGENR